MSESDPIGVGRSAWQSAIGAEDDKLWGLISSNPTMADGSAYFAASHGNLLTAAGLTSASLALASAALRAQTNSTGVRMNLEPWGLLVGTGLEQTARALVA